MQSIPHKAFHVQRFSKEPNFLALIVFVSLPLEPPITPRTPHSLKGNFMGGCAPPSGKGVQGVSGKDKDTKAANAQAKGVFCFVL